MSSSVSDSSDGSKGSHLLTSSAARTTGDRIIEEKSFSSHHRKYGDKDSV